LSQGRPVRGESAETPRGGVGNTGTKKNEGLKKTRSTQKKEKKFRLGEEKGFNPLDATFVRTKNQDRENRSRGKNRQGISRKSQREATFQSHPRREKKWRIIGKEKTWELKKKESTKGTRQKASRS